MKRKVTPRGKSYWGSFVTYVDGKSPVAFVRLRKSSFKSFIKSIVQKTQLFQIYFFDCNINNKFCADCKCLYF